MNKKLKQDVDNNELHEQIKITRKRIKSRTRAFFKSEAKAALEENNMKGTWKFIKRATFTGNKGSPSLPDLQELNNYFSDLVTIADPSPTSSTQTVPQTIPVTRSYESITLFNLQCTDVHATTRLLRHIRTNSAAGPDDLSAFFLMNYSYSLAPNIT